MKDGWMNGWMDEWMDGWTDVLIDVGGIDGLIGFYVPFRREDCLGSVCHTGTGVADKGSFPPVTVY